VHPPIVLLFAALIMAFGSLDFSAHFLRRATKWAAKWATAAYFDALGDALGGGAAAARGAKKSRTRN